ncbi:hypothetical protein [Trichlorobacter ammonificans]|uniref:DUF2642 domain-containing protein n=1 Tax=Trichlorobacter ammonificans TaxID=2916410 RepID=A0ABM9D6W2_9BACT|nr:hypothetical protein [Trichlorobacter ammonificans]CAH2030174.1 protein of unknown function [Trichlorobacter ammonificans]
MTDQLTQLMHCKQLISFLVPAMAKPLKGIVESVNNDKVTILADYAGERIRIVTHPNTVVLVERAN